MDLKRDRLRLPKMERSISRLGPVARFVASAVETSVTTTISLETLYHLLLWQ
jgi:hypothetical protein